MASLEAVLEFASAPNAMRLKELIAPSMPAVHRGLAERGRSVPINIVAANTATTPTPSAILALIEMRRSAELSHLEFWYVLTGIELHMVATERRDSEIGNIISDLAEREVDETTIRRAELLLRGVAT